MAIEDVIMQASEDADLGPIGEDSVVDDTPQGEVEVDTAGNESRVEPSGSSMPGDDKSPQLTDEQKKAAEELAANEKLIGVPRLRPDGRTNRIPWDRIPSIVDNKVKGILAEKEAEWKSKYEPIESRAKELEAEAEEWAAAKEAMSKDMPSFMKFLAEKIHPDYSKYQIAQVVEQMKDDANDPEPGPTGQNEDGSTYYTHEDLSKLRAWDRRAAKREAKAEALAEVEKTYGPVKQKMDAETMRAEDAKQAKKILDEAETWPEFGKFKDSTMKYFMENKNLSLPLAYIKHVVPQLMKSQEDLKKELRPIILKEIKEANAVKDTSVGGGSGDAKADDSGKPKSIEEIIRERSRAAGLIGRK